MSLNTLDLILILLLEVGIVPPIDSPSALRGVSGDIGIFFFSFTARCDWDVLGELFQAKIFISVYPLSNILMR